MQLNVKTTAMVVVLMLPFGGTATAQGPAPGMAHAALQDVDGMDIGSVTWTQGATAFTVEVAVQGLPSGFHGFHVHATGACVAPFTSAGGHLDPDGTAQPGHAADQPALLVMADGTGWATFTTDRYAVGDIVGAAVIVHADPDNHANIPERYLAPGPSAPPAASAEPVLVAGPDAATLATGDAGPRLACGVIEPGGAAAP